VGAAFWERSNGLFINGRGERHQWEGGPFQPPEGTEGHRPAWRSSVVVTERGEIGGMPRRADIMGKNVLACLLEGKGARNVSFSAGSYTV